MTPDALTLTTLDDIEEVLGRHGALGLSLAGELIATIRQDRATMARLQRALIDAGIDPQLVLEEHST